MDIVQWNLCDPTPQFSDILWHPTKIFGHKSISVNWSKTRVFWHPVKSDTFPWSLAIGVSDYTGSIVYDTAVGHENKRNILDTNFL